MSDNLKIILHLGREKLVKKKQCHFLVKPYLKTTVFQVPNIFNQCFCFYIFCFQKINYKLNLTIFQLYHGGQFYLWSKEKGQKDKQNNYYKMSQRKLEI